MDSGAPRSAIVGYHQDDEGHWVAELACGHGQHVRHSPPFQDRAWVTEAAGREAHLGTNLVCPFCRMPKLPEGMTEYKRVGPFDPHTVPKGLLSSHRLKAGVWGEIVVTEGRVVYVLEDDGDFGLPLRPGVVGTVAPERPHHVEPQPGCSFYVRFLR